MNRALQVVVFLLGAHFTFAQPRPQALAAQIPFIGCRSDGQTGPLDAPNDKSKAVSIEPAAALQLAYYKAENGLGILAPRGWHCFGTYGSSGETLYVSREPMDRTNLLSPKWSGFTGPVIEITHQYGSTSGRFSVARTIARVFPSRGAFVKAVIAERIEPAAAFPSGPYPQDKLRYKSKEMVEYETPGRTNGLGTNSKLRKNQDPIRGVAILVGTTPDLVLLMVRLPSDAGGLVHVIIQHVEQEAAPSETHGR